MCRPYASLHSSATNSSRESGDESGGVPKSIPHANRHQRVHQSRRCGAGAGWPAGGHRRRLPTRRLVDAVLRPRSDGVGRRRGAKRTDALLYGRRTWQVMAGAWPARAGDPFADWINAVEKHVVSNTLSEADLTWEPTTLIRGADLSSAINALRERPGGDVNVMGSAQLVLSLLEADLVDEMNLMIEPIVLGGGKTIFPADGIGASFRPRLRHHRGHRRAGLPVRTEPCVSQLNEIGFYTLAGAPQSPAELLDEVAKAESLGFGSAFISERFNIKEAVTLSGAVAGASRTLGIATAATNHNTRHPVVTASYATTMHRLTGGRFTLGLGRGIAPLFDAYGIPRITTAQLEDFVGLMRRLFHGEVVIGHDGPAGSYPVLHLDASFDEDIPIGFVAFGPNSLAFAGRASTWSCSTRSSPTRPSSGACARCATRPSRPAATRRPCGSGRATRPCTTASPRSSASRRRSAGSRPTSRATAISSSRRTTGIRRSSTRFRADAVVAIVPGRDRRQGRHRHARARRHAASGRVARTGGDRNARALRRARAPSVRPRRRRRDHARRDTGRARTGGRVVPDASARRPLRQAGSQPRPLIEGRCAYWSTASTPSRKNEPSSRLPTTSENQCTPRYTRLAATAPMTMPDARNRRPPQRAAAREQADDDGQESVERDRSHHMTAGERVALTVDEAFEVRPCATDDVLEDELEQRPRGRRDEDRDAHGTASTPRQEDQQRADREHDNGRARAARWQGTASRARPSGGLRRTVGSEDPIATAATRG